MMAKREMTERQLIAFCRAKDAKDRRGRHEEIKLLASVMAQPKFDPSDWEIGELKRLVHCIYGRSLMKD
jgi:hypothetical protein